MRTQGMRTLSRGAAIGVAALAFLLTTQMAGGPAAEAAPEAASAAAPATLILDLKLDVGAAGAALRLSL